MATRKLTQVPPVKQYKGSVGEHYDEMSRALRQLHAALLTCSGGGFESFDEYAPGIKDDYLGMLSDLAERALEHAEFLMPRRSSAGQWEVANG